MRSFSASSSSVVLAPDPFDVFRLLFSDLASICIPSAQDMLAATIIIKAGMIEINSVSPLE